MEQNGVAAPFDVLFVGDHPQADPLRTHFEKRLEFRLYQVACGEAALAALRDGHYDIVMLCPCRTGKPGLRVLAEGRHLHPSVPFIVLTDDHSPQTAVAAMQLGAYDYLNWPVDPELLEFHVDRARRHVIMSRTVTRLQQAQNTRGCCGMVGASAAIRRVYDLVADVAPTSTTVLIIGETGTGKELVAHAIHEASARRLKPFVPINCAAVPEALLESELFGHVRGSFTGAVSSQRGLLAAASEGTALLDDIEALTPAMQGKLLRAIEERTIQQVGGKHEVHVDFRLIAATNVVLEELVADGTFREDLFYRLSVFPIELPPLRERRDDIPSLVTHFAGEVAKALGIDPPFVSQAILDGLIAHDWPGNVRELRNWVERAVILSRGSGAISLPPPRLPGGGRPPSLLEHARLGWSLRQLSEEYTRAVLEYTGGHRTRAAEILGINRRTLHRRALKRPSWTRRARRTDETTAPPS